MLFFGMAFLFYGQVLGQGTEDFTNIPTASSTSYLSRTWTGTDGVTWTAEGARTDQTMNGKAICFGNSGINRWVTSPVYSNGMGVLSFNYVRAFTGTSARSIEVWVDGVQIGSSITVSPTSNVVVAYSQAINVTGYIQLEIRSTGAAQVKIDDVAWASYAGSPSSCTGPLNGTYTINSGAPASCTNYQSISAALSDLKWGNRADDNSFRNGPGVSGAVVFNIASGTYTMQISLTEIQGASSTNTITFQSSSGINTDVTLTYASSSAIANNYTLQLNGTDYFRFKNMTIERSGTNTYSRVIDFIGSASNNTFDGNRIIGRVSGSSSLANNATIACDNTDAGNVYNVFSNNYILYGYAGVYWLGTSGTRLTNMTVSSNTLTNYRYGVYLSYCSNITITGNSISVPASYNSASMEGVSTSQLTGMLTISKNNIVLTSATSNNGINLQSSVGDGSNIGDISNNMMVVAGSGTVNGINSGSLTSYKNYYYNSVYNTGSNATSASAYYQNGSSNINLKNNILFGTVGNAIEVLAPTTGLVSSDYNDLYTTGVAVGNWSGTNQAAIANWRTASSLDANSISADPSFVSTTDLHVNSGSPTDGAATSLSITTDIDGDARNGSTPDIGGDEYVASNSITTGAVSTTPFCVSATGTASGTVAFTSLGTYTGNTYTAQLSNSSGSFASPTNIGTLVSNANSGSISITIPANTATGAGYKIQVISSYNSITGSSSAAFTINLGPANVSGQSASNGNGQSVISWTNPATCFDEIMIVAKASAFTGAVPSGTAYTHNSNSFTDGANSAFDGGVVVYKGSSSPETITSLTNGTTYNFKIFARKNNDWSSGVTCTATPAVVNYVAFDNFNRTDNTTVGTPSSGGSAWTENEAVAGLCEIYNNRHDINNNNPASRAWTSYDMSSKYSTIFSAANKTLTWVFNMSQSRPDPSGFANNNYGVAFVLGADEAIFTSATCDGYAVVLGQSGTTDAVRLIRFTNGLTTSTGTLTDIISYGDYGNELLRIKIEFNPCTSEWKLYLEDDGSPADSFFNFSDPTTVTTQRGSATVDNTFTSYDLKYMGCFWDYATSAGEYASFDNISIPDASTGIYTWNGSTNDYQVSTAWTPTRTCPQISDVLRFNNGIANIAANVPTETIARLMVSSGTEVNMRAATGNTLTIQGGTGTDLDVAAGCQLNIDGSNPLIISLSTGATGSISGNMSFSNGAHRLRAVDNMSLTFNSGAVFTGGSGLTGNVFGTATTNQPQIVFASGSSYVFLDGQNPFGASQPNSVIVFQPGSLYKHSSNSLLPSYAGRSYANFEYDFSGSLSSLAGSPATCTINGNMTFTNGSYNFLHQQPFDITGNLTVGSGKTFNYSPSTAATFNFNGTGAQTIGGGGSISFGTNVTFQVSNNTSLSSTVNVYGTASVTAGTLASAGNLVIEDGGTLLHGAGTTGGGGAVSGNIVVKRQGNPSGSNKYNYWSTPVSGGTLPGSSGYQYISASGTNSNSDDIPGPDPGWSSFSGTMLQGKGYASIDGGLASFTGASGNGDVSPFVTYYGLSSTSLSPNSDFVLLGNPYPSGLTVDNFINDNSGVLSGQVWAWDDDGSGGTTYSTGDYNSRTLAGNQGGGNGHTISAQLGVAQGFFAKAIATGSVTFQNSQRNAAAGNFFKTESEISRIWISLNNESLYNEINIVFMDGATDGFDNMLDGQKLRGNANIAFAVRPEGTTAIEDELCIAALPLLTGETIVPLTTFVSTEGVYTIKNKASENFDNISVYLEDRMEGTFTSLDNNGYYETEINEENVTNRFYLHFSPLVTSTNNNITEPGISAYIHGEELFVQFRNFTEPEGKLLLNDIAGRQLFMSNNINLQDGITGINISGFAPGIYFVNLLTGKGCYTRKIFIK